MRRYFEWVLAHRNGVLLLVGLLTATAGYSVSRAVLASSLGDMFFGDAPVFARYVELIETFGSDEIVAVAYDEDDPLSPEALDRLERIADAITSDPEVQRVSGLHTLDRVTSEDGLLTVQTYAEAARDNPEQRAELIAEIQDDPILSRTFIGASGTTASILVELKVDPDRSGEVGPRIVGDTLKTFAENGYPEDTIHRAGFPAVMTEMLVQARYSLSHILPITLLVLTLAVTVLFRTALPVILSMGVSGLSALFSVGAAAAVDPHLSIFYAIIPAVVTVVAVSDVIHMWSAYLHELKLGKDKREAILTSAEDVGRACLLTSITTFVGFMSISLIPTPVFQELGWVLGLGVATALLLAMTLVPIFADMGPEPDPKTLEMDNIVARVVDHIVAASAHISTRFPRRVILVFALFGGAVLYLSSIRSIETDFLKRFDQDNVIPMDNAFFETEYTGSQAIDVFITGKTPDAMLNIDAMARMTAFEDALEARPNIDQAISHLDALRQTHAALTGDDRLPKTQAAAAQELLLLEMGGGQALDSVLSHDRSSARIALRATEHRMRATHALARDVERQGSEMMGDEFTVEATGMMPLCGGWIDEIVTGQRNGVLTSIVAITMLMMLGLRSMSVGLISAIPNLLPLVATAALTGLVWGDIDSDTLVILMLAIGIGVDDTIHILMRYRIESLRCKTQAEAIAQTFAFSGRAIVMTTVILAVGFTPMAMTQYYSMSIMGTLLPAALIVAMVADLLLVPALAQVGWLRFRATEAE